MIYSYIRLQKWLTRSATSRIFCWWKKIWMTTNNIYSLRNNYVYNMPTNQLFSLTFTISNQSASGIKSEIRPLICQRTHYGNLERQKRQNRFKSSSFQITAAMFFKFCKLILKIIVALDNNSATFVFLVGFWWIYPKVSLLLYYMCAKRIKFLMTRLSVCGLGVWCNEMSDTPMLLVVLSIPFIKIWWLKFTPGTLTSISQFQVLT